MIKGCELHSYKNGVFQIWISEGEKENVQDIIAYLLLDHCNVMKPLKIYNDIPNIHEEESW